MAKTTKHRLPGMPCPHCAGHATQRKGNQITEIVREIYYRCENDACGCVFVAQIATVRIIVQSSHPKPGIHVPFSPIPLKPAPANDDHPIERPPASNDDAVIMTG